MQIKETLSKGLKREYNLVIPADYIEKKVELKLTQLGKRAKIAGFRPGKIPMPMLKQRYGMEVLGEALEQAVEDGIETIVKKHDLKPALRPEIDASEKYQEGKDLTVTVKMECLPEVAEIKLDDMKFEKLEPKVDPKKIDEAILQAGKSHRETKPLAKARKTKAGDIAIIDFDGKVGDEAITGGSATDHPLELGSNTFIPGFEDQLIGHDKGAHVEVKVTFPKEYGESKLAGQEARFQVTIKDIHEPQALEINEDLAKKLGFEGLDKCREAVKGFLSRDDHAMAFMHTKRCVLDALASKCTFEVPGKMIEAEFESIWKQMLREAGLDGADAANKNAKKSFEESTGSKEEDLRKEYLGIAERRVRLGLVLADIGQRNKVSVSDHEMTNALIAEARRYPGQEKDVIEYYRKNSQAMAALRAPLFEDKVIEYILSQAKVTTKEVTSEELLKIMSEDDILPNKKAEKKSEKATKKA